jgi:hypothetical protein
MWDVLPSTFAKVEINGELQTVGNQKFLITVV